eukprot:4159248-Pyramimonas_sp.AAC.1
MFFLDKPDGRVRPIGLLCLVLRLWSRLRQPYCRAWEKNHAEVFYWGTGAHNTCERAGWVHNLLGGFCKEVGFECGSVLVDLNRFYENIRHLDLRLAGLQYGFPIE